MKELLLQIAKALVDNPEKVEVKEILGDKSTILELKVSDTDRGKIIGKEGRIIKSIRTIISSSAAKLNKRASVEIIE
ncbi:MAG: KH domain-containing protein [Elusimicrobiota bacterium]|nr:KH domain-containing protein [Elusimicrobiota bacterium]